MREVVIPRIGGPEVLELRERPDPTPGPGEVRVRVRASGVNFADVMARLGLYPDAGVGAAEREGRVRDRLLILDALAAEDLLPPDARSADGQPGPMTPALSRAIQIYLARSNAAVLVVQPEDWLGMESPVNVPGTSSEYPNWARKLDGEWEGMLARADVRDVVRAVAAARGS